MYIGTIWYHTWVSLPSCNLQIVPKESVSTSHTPLLEGFGEAECAYVYACSHKDARSVRPERTGVHDDIPYSYGLYQKDLIWLAEWRNTCHWVHNLFRRMFRACRGALWSDTSKIMISILNSRIIKQLAVTSNPVNNAWAICNVTTKQTRLNHLVEQNSELHAPYYLTIFLSVSFPLVCVTVWILWEEVEGESSLLLSTSALND